MKYFNRFLLAVFTALVFASAQAKDLSTQDIVEITQLYAKYNHAIDGGNAEAWADTFTEDGVFNTRFKGREQLMGFIKTWKDGGGASRRHWNSNLMLTGTSEGADGAVYLTLWNIGTKPQTIMTTGMYEDKLVKTKSGWRFKSRLVKADTPAPTAPAAEAK
jgi:hypothetical protein